MSSQNDLQLYWQRARVDADRAAKISIENNHPSAVLAIKLRVACLYLFIIYTISVVIGPLPIRILNPGWYRSLNNLFISNGPILIVALEAQRLGSEKQLAQPLRQRLLALVTDSVCILVSALVLAAEGA